MRHEGTTSDVARRLAANGLLDRGLDGVDARAWRIIVTARGAAVLARARPEVDAAASRFHARRRLP